MLFLAHFWLKALKALKQVPQRSPFWVCQHGMHG
jgi:hypothetical protein